MSEAEGRGEDDLAEPGQQAPPAPSERISLMSSLSPTRNSSTAIAELRQQVDLLVRATMPSTDGPATSRPR